MGRYWSMQTTLRISSKLGSDGTMSQNGGRYSSTSPDDTVRRHISHNTRPLIIWFIWRITIDYLLTLKLTERVHVHSPKRFKNAHIDSVKERVLKWNFRCHQLERHENNRNDMKIRWVFACVITFDLILRGSCNVLSLHVDYWQHSFLPWFACE